MEAVDSLLRTRRSNPPPKEEGKRRGKRGARGTETQRVSRRHCDLAASRMHVEAMIGGLPARLCMGTALTLALCIDLGHIQPAIQPTTTALLSRRRRCRWVDDGGNDGAWEGVETADDCLVVGSEVGVVCRGDLLALPRSPPPPLLPRLGMTDHLCICVCVTMSLDLSQRVYCVRVLLRLCVH